MSRPRSLNLSLTDELRRFLDAHSGEGTHCVTPSEFVRDLIRREQERIEAARFRQAVLEGYDDALHGRTHEFTGDLRGMLEEFRARNGRSDTESR